MRKTPEGDVSLPITHAYNHHYGAQMLGSGSRMERVPYDPNDGGRTTLLTPEPGWDYIPVEHTPSATGLPTSLGPYGSNGGEYRKSYHGLAAPFVQVIESPHAFSMTPMQARPAALPPCVPAAPRACLPACLPACLIALPRHADRHLESR